MIRPVARTLCLALALLPGLVLAETPPPQQQQPASIAFANQGGIRNWKADGTRGLWVQDNRNRWYYATLMGPCSGLDFANALLFDTGPDGSLDQHSSVRFRDGSVMHRYCPFKTFLPSEGPPAKKKGKQPVQKAGEPAAAPAETTPK